ncbi:1-acyl-sn-glycerol-3-phosphate acyltransferase [Marmoricola sp. OAE513]|uniref:1-acyl-sn-glycerol-3-phosphate acyltransferase n=1 Tax=Marmoricola sp. OAE513 TaxID=2817894 RepID=UPI001AE33509
MAQTMKVRRAIARSVLQVTRWNLVGEAPPEAGILVGAPHTSRWDWVVTMLMTWSHGSQPSILIKHTYFTGPMGSILRRTGGIPLDRENPGATIRALLKEADGHPNFLLAIAPEGIRGKGEYWKAGFYRIAQQTGLPITLGFVDGPSRSVGIGPTFHPTDDIVADMDLVRAFYADKVGIVPENGTVPRLREESA